VFALAIAQASAQRGETNPPLNLVTTGMESYALYVLPLGVASDKSRLGVFAGASVLVLAVGYTTRTPVNPDILEKLFGLTPAESRLASLIGTGIAPREAASLLNITEETARTVLKRVFSKANVARQPELVALLNRLAMQ
jgi:DNA-binding CsgD family transcriptional regulator